MIETVGFAGGLLTAFAFLPQVVKTWRSRSAEDLSFAMLGAQSAGVALWIVYGVAMKSTPIVFANICTLSQSLTLLAFKYKWGRT